MLGGDGGRAAAPSPPLLRRSPLTTPFPDLTRPQLPHDEAPGGGEGDEGGGETAVDDTAGLVACTPRLAPGARAAAGRDARVVLGFRHPPPRPCDGEGGSPGAVWVGGAVRAGEVASQRESETRLAADALASAAAAQRSQGAGPSPRRPAGSEAGRPELSAEAVGTRCRRVRPDMEATFLRRLQFARSALLGRRPEQVPGSVAGNRSLRLMAALGPSARHEVYACVVAAEGARPTGLDAEAMEELAQACADAWRAAEQDPRRLAPFPAAALQACMPSGV